MIIKNPAKYSLLMITLLTFKLITLQSCSPKQENKDNKNQSDSSGNIIAKTDNISLFAITDNDTAGKYNIISDYYDDRKSLRFLKKPAAGIKVMEQVFTDKSNTDESNKISLLLFSFDDIDKAKLEAKVNFNLLENLLKKENHSIESFSVNTTGDESIGIILSKTENPVYLYCRIGNLFIKLNGGKNIQMDNLVNLLKLIDDKVKKQN